MDSEATPNEKEYTFKKKGGTDLKIAKMRLKGFFLALMFENLRNRMISFSCLFYLIIRFKYDLQFRHAITTVEVLQQS